MVVATVAVIVVPAVVIGAVEACVAHSRAGMAWYMVWYGMVWYGMVSVFVALMIFWWVQIK